MYSLYIYNYSIRGWVCHMSGSNLPPLVKVMNRHPIAKINEESYD